ncbi:MAG: carbohydrate kinase family protein [Acidobacteria bacterium]|nr:carbohydrate kinase family protein [Acidobacteriota bacterium]
MSEFSESFATSAQNFDVVNIGDVVTDEFIRLPDGPVRVRADETGRWLDIPLGTKLVIQDDEPPPTAGSAANAAVAMSRLGLRVGLATYLAHDQIGLDILSAMHGENVGTSVVHVDSPNHTVRNFVLSFGAERTILVRTPEFNYHWTGLRDHDIPAWLYINSLGPDALTYQDEIADWLEQHPHVRMAFHPGIFQLEAGTERLARLYAAAEVLLCERSAAESITGVSYTDPNRVLDALLDLGATNVVVYHESGEAIAANGSERVRIGPFDESEPPLDLTGAGDAFAATTVTAFVRGAPLREALRWASANLAATSRQIGTQGGLLRRDELIARLAAAPADFVARDL